MSQELIEIKKIVDKWAKKTESKMKRILLSKRKGNTRIYKMLKLKTVVYKETLIIDSNLPGYAPFVDKGRKPGKQPPIKVIESWCKSRNIDKKAAFPIARKIGQRGIPPTGFLKPLGDLNELISVINEGMTKMSLLIFKNK